MEDGDIVRRLKTILSETANIDPASIDPHLPLLRGGLELDSLSAATFLAAVQNEFGVDILEEDLSLSSLDSLDAMARFISNQ